jgi:hypothetical protein
MKPKRNERKLIEKSRIIIKRSDETQEKWEKTHPNTKKQSTRQLTGKSQPRSKRALQLPRKDVAQGSEDANGRHVSHLTQSNSQSTHSLITPPQHGRFWRKEWERRNLEWTGGRRWNKYHPQPPPPKKNKETPLLNVVTRDSKIS